METKPWYASKTVWASVVTVILSLATMLKIGHVGPVPLDSVAQEQDSLVEILTQIALVVSGLVSLWGRLTARTVIGTTP